MIIIGAGMSGLLAARRFANMSPIIYERQERLPNNHSALLRFRSDEISRLTNIDFKQVRIYKSIILPDGEVKNTVTIADMNAYSHKILGIIHSRSITNMDPGFRWVAPDNFISLLAQNVKVRFDQELTNFKTQHEPIISTMPMPDLMHILDYPDKPDFHYKPIWTINCVLKDVDVYQTAYVPYLSTMPYRVSITGNKMTLEFATGTVADVEDEAEGALCYFAHKLFGIVPSYSNVTIRQQPYGKIIPINEDIRRAFIMWASDNFGIYSLGRYAIWKSVLLDDLIDDMHIIDQLIKGRSIYSIKKG